MSQNLDPISMTVKEELKPMFDMFDGDGDGKISLAELGAVLRSLGTEASHEELSQIMPELDTDGDGFIDFEEFKAFHSRGGGDVDKDLKEAFDLYDKDKNGKISEVELHSFLCRLGHNCTVQDCRRMIRSVDVDGDGFVDFQEFKMMMRTRDSS